MKFTDSHCHLDFSAFDSDREKLLLQCAESNIANIIIPAVSPNTWHNIFEIISANTSTSKLYACLGIHPWYLNDLNTNHLQQLATEVHQNKDNIIAIGETGLDGVIATEQNNLLKQQEFFEFHLHLASSVNLPVIVHHRRTHNEIIQQLKQNIPSQGGIIHAFSGSYQQGKTYIDLGFKLGVGSTITYSRAKKTINAIKRFPLDALVLETDAPAMPINSQQGQRNTPLTLLTIFDVLTEIRTEKKENIAEVIENNIQQLFGIT